jgi:hypothetical protein
LPYNGAALDIDKPIARRSLAEIAMTAEEGDRGNMIWTLNIVKKQTRDRE